MAVLSSNILFSAKRAGERKCCRQEEQLGEAHVPTQGCVCLCKAVDGGSQGPPNTDFPPHPIPPKGGMLLLLLLHESQKRP